MVKIKTLKGASKVDSPLYIVFNRLGSAFQARILFAGTKENAKKFGMKQFKVNSSGVKLKEVRL